jgi:class 3 adenylate cyclase
VKRLLDRALTAKLRLTAVDTSVTHATIHAVAASVDSRRPNFVSQAAPDGTVTLMFSDMEDYTGILERLGDQAAHGLVRAHNDIVRRLTGEFGGHEVELRGDGFLLAFSSARTAVLCAVALQRAFDGESFGEDETIRVRIGLHTGETIKEADAFFGKSVVQAFRIADMADGGQILLSGTTHDLVESAGDLRFDEERLIALKGLTGMHRVFPLLWGDAAAATSR